jgi:hypothetical protein
VISEGEKEVLRIPLIELVEAIRKSKPRAMIDDNLMRTHAEGGGIKATVVIEDIDGSYGDGQMKLSRLIALVFLN